MQVSTRATATAAVQSALLGWLPEAEMAVSVLDRAALVVDVADDDGRVVGVGVGVENAPTLSGAPVMLACVARDAGATALLARSVVPLAAAAGGVEVLGPGTVAKDVASTLGQRVHGTARSVMEQRLLVATSVEVPWGVAGWARRLRPSDHQQVARWMDDFSVEALHGTRRGVGHWLPQVARAGYDIRVWEVGGQLVSMVNGRRTTPVSSRIGPVYTPPEHRGRGHAAALTAHVVRAALRGRDERVTLFTDVTNATSTSLYLRIGFEDVAAHSSWAVQPNG